MFSRKILVVALLMSVVSLPVRAADPVVITQPAIGQILAPELPVSLSAALSNAREVMQKKKELSESIAKARAAYWAAYPAGPNLAELEKAYAEQLAIKDMYYFLTRVGDKAAAGKNAKPNATMDKLKGFGVSGAADAADLATGRVDGGIDSSGQPLFNLWADAMMKNLGNGAALATMPLTQFSPALEASAAEYLAYKQHRDLHEFLMSPIAVKVAPKLLFQHLLFAGNFTSDSKLAGQAYDTFAGALGMNVVQDLLDKHTPRPSEGGVMSMLATNPGQALWASLMDAYKSKYGEKKTVAFTQQTVAKAWNFNVKVPTEAQKTAADPVGNATNKLGGFLGGKKK